MVGVARDQAALQRLHGLGADATVDLRPKETAADLADRILAVAGPVDVVLDGVYGLPFEAALQACAPYARVINIGSAAGTTAQIPAGALRAKQLTLSGFAGVHTPLQAKRTALDWLWAAVICGELQVEVRAIPLEQLPAVWRAQAHSPHEKCVVVPAEGPRHSAVLPVGHSTA
ncbi:zinc-binding dehydrogenase [Amycolatopsis sp. H20-H5]|uniref:zinc-binding dehydrogenase n=1 Tax=Amycolatopsis sp. H20-H5 TaxID=3046309 RepID=UPI002DB9FAA6|nr:zinc-binding dehydrogenase [Amycolatopsis sp. H20-H5]MEC3978027.1 zinc-binding dehydrogenase [Amycolatopsis sp. H20-H5]